MLFRSTEETDNSLEISRNLFVLYNEKGILSLELHNYRGNGEESAANPETSHYTCLDMAQKKVLSLQDIIKPDSLILNQLLEPKLKAELSRFAKASTDTSPLQPLNNNFFITGGGLWFCYNPGSLRSDIGEEIIVHLKWAELYGLLNDDFRKRMGI